jgi:hypothetical protein
MKHSITTEGEYKVEKWRSEDLPLKHIKFWGSVQVPWDTRRSVGDHTYYSLKSYEKYEKYINSRNEKAFSMVGFTLKKHHLEKPAEIYLGKLNWWLYGIELTKAYERI